MSAPSNHAKKDFADHTRKPTLKGIKNRQKYFI